MRTYVIADLHGRYDLLVEAARTINVHSQQRPCRLVVTGDFVDRGPKASDIVRELRNWRFPNIDLVVLRGNHEDMMLEVLDDPTPHQMRWWVGNGGGATLASYGYENGDQLKPYPQQLVDDMTWLKTLPYYFETEKQVFVHAAVLPDLPMSQQPTAILTWQCWDENWKKPWDNEEGGEHRDADYSKHVVHGHEQWAKGPILLANRTDLDTFAWYTGRLAIGVFDDSQGGPIDILWAEGEPHGGS